MQKQSPLLRIWSWGKEEHGRLTRAIASAFLGVALGMLPYFCAAQIIIKLLAGEKEIRVYPAMAFDRDGRICRPYAAL